MLIIPAIDLINGKCVRLTQGKYDAVTKYTIDPVQVARSYEQQGADVIHVIDLDGAKSGQTQNLDVIAKIVSAVNVPVQVGGGIRTLANAQRLLGAGVTRVIIGTAALENPAMITALIQAYGASRVVVSLDVAGNNVKVRGWEESSTLSLLAAIELLQSTGVETIIVTDISRDGMLQGVDARFIETVIEQVQPFGVNVIVAGGVTSVADIALLQQANMTGAIIGKALYENTLTLTDVTAMKLWSMPKRVIPCMDIKDGRVVKGVQFTQLQDSGDAVELAKQYEQQGADELVFLDICATNENRKTLYELVERVAKAISIPFTVGGGVSSLEDIRTLLRAGADKVSIGSAAIRDSAFVRSAVETFGSQCIVISIDAKSNNKKSWEAYIQGGKVNTGVDAIVLAKQMAELGVGELLVNSLDRDGTQQGYDIELLRAIKLAVSISVIASSGAGSNEDVVEVIRATDVDAVLAASMYHSGGTTVQQTKQILQLNDINVRL